MPLGRLAARLELEKRGLRPPRNGPARQAPPGVRLWEMEYAQRLASLQKLFGEHALRMARREVRADALSDDLREVLALLIRGSGIDSWLEQRAEQTLERQVSYAQRVTRIPPAGARAGAQAAIEEFRQENVRLITRMGEKQIQEIADIVRPAQAFGGRWEELAPQIEERLKVGRSRAKLIARDQTNKFNGSMQQITQEASGISRYAWGVSGDMAVRGRPGGVNTRPGGEDHWVLRNQVFEWARPPLIPGTNERAHPGQRPLCRCVALPVVEFFT